MYNVFSLSNIARKDDAIGQSPARAFTPRAAKANGSKTPPTPSARAALPALSAAGEWR